MRDEASGEYSTVLGCLLALSAVLMTPSAFSQSEADAGLQDRFEQSCIETQVVDSMSTEVREAVTRVCRESSVGAAQMSERLGNCERECQLGRSALKWAKSQGFEECLVGWTRSTGHNDVLVIVDPGLGDRRLWTQDVPFGLSRFNLPQGSHLCKWDYIGGPSAVIDSNGSEVDFLFTDWVEG